MLVEWWQALDGIEGVGLAIAAVISAIGAILAARWSYLSRNHAKGAEDQVANDHSSNLREDLDQVSATLTTQGEALSDVSRQIQGVALGVARIEDLAALIRSQGHQIGEIRGDLRDVRGDLRSAGERHEEDMRRVEGEIKRLDSPASPQP